jgi:UDP-N-acetylmuramyl pentapeptide synthase
MKASLEFDLFLIPNSRIYNLLRVIATALDLGIK